MVCLNTSLEVGKSRARLIGSRCLVCLTTWSLGGVAQSSGHAGKLCPECPFLLLGEDGAGPGHTLLHCEVVQCLLECQACGYGL